MLTPNTTAIRNTAQGTVSQVITLFGFLRRHETFKISCSVGSFILEAPTTINKYLKHQRKHIGHQSQISYGVMEPLFNNKLGFPSF
ncbi:hypothetical protein NDU88_006898 [Pleurodeles waltl]|uniref:Uncharacterized protein n=1 Tax=Pleurodeles waltl TaxID=8319 RepID=A0AAV7WFA4_PLEWA|nr:hypothetical protein NDU88_006898 [Pleurodeles waltl]